MPTLSERLSGSLAERYAIERQVGEGGMATIGRQLRVVFDWFDALTGSSTTR